MRKGEVERVAAMVTTDGKSSRQVLVEAVELAIQEGLTGAEIVALVDTLELTLGAPIHPVRLR